MRCAVTIRPHHWRLARPGSSFKSRVIAPNTIAGSTKSGTTAEIGPPKDFATHLPHRLRPLGPAIPDDAPWQRSREYSSGAQSLASKPLRARDRRVCSSGRATSKASSGVQDRRPGTLKIASWNSVPIEPALLKTLRRSTVSGPPALPTARHRPWRTISAADASFPSATSSWPHAGWRRSFRRLRDRRDPYATHPHHDRC